MDFYVLVDQVVKLLRQRRRLSYRSLKRQFDLDDAALKDLKEEILFSQPTVLDDNNRGLIWQDSVGKNQSSAARTARPSQGPTVPTRNAQSEPPVKPSAADGERRRLSVMFSDLVDATTLSGQVDPEEYRAVLRAYHSVCAEVIHRYSGFIAQHLGDALLVYFGYPRTHEDEAQRAIHAALGMLEAVRSLNTRLQQEKGIRLAVRIGIHTGLTVIGAIGEGAQQEILALGETPNIASRIQVVAEPDSVAISADTYQLVRDYFKVKDLDFHSLKGVAAPMKVYRVLQKRTPQSRLELASTRGLTPFVGRQREIAKLLEYWEQVKAGRGQVVLLSGDGGIGKTRLVREFKDRIADDKQIRFECRSSPYFQNSALYPVIELWQQMFAVAEAASERFDDLDRFLRQQDPAIEKNASPADALDSAPRSRERRQSLAMSSPRERQHTLENIVTALLKQAQQRPVLFILEDLHWTDPSTIELLNSLIRRLPPVAFYLLMTYRPTFHPPWDLGRQLPPLVLGRLSPGQTEQMVAGMTGGKHLPTAVLQQIVEKTDGVPLFVEETTKAVVESGVLEEQDGHYALTGKFSAPAIPATLNDSLMSRLDRLGNAKNIAQIGAVIGRDFSYELLRAVAKSEDQILLQALERLVKADLLNQKGMPPGAVYAFKHALIQDAAYQSLLKSARQEYHRGTALVLEAKFPERAKTEPELLAHHLTEARLPEKAIGYWRKAGEQAVQRSAKVEAISHLNRGLALCRGLPVTPQRQRLELDMRTTLARL